MGDAHYMVLSDLHLTDVEEHGDGWKAHKSSRYVFDGAFSACLAAFVERAGGDDTLTLVLNGDVIDFDLVTATPVDPGWGVSPRERKEGLRPTAARSAWKLEHVLDHHPRFVRSVADFVAGGHQLVYVLGNHDRELHFDEVQEVFLRTLEAAGAQGFDRERVRFEPWFFHVPGRLHAEHGQQYDYYNSWQDLLEPTVELGGERRLVLPMGNLSNRVLLGRMGFFNPHATDYILGFFSYVAHWSRHYALSRRSILLPWFLGSVRVLFELIWTERRVREQRRGDRAAGLRAAAQRQGLSLAAVQDLDRRARPPITHNLFRVVREFWLDRLLLALTMSGATVALALSPIPLWIKLMVPLSAFPLLYLVYEWLAHGQTVSGAGHGIAAEADGIARALGVRVVTFGHSHEPKITPLHRGATFVNTGTWAPLTEEGALVPGFRNYLWLRFRGEEVDLHLGSWMEAGEEPRSEVAHRAPTLASSARDRPGRSEGREPGLDGRHEGIRVAEAL